jgi:broad specificity phosphatase PhoE
VRLEPVIVELERQRSPVLIVAHQAVIRVLYGYLMGKPQDECPYLQVPLHTVVQLRPTEYGYDEERFALGASPAR